MEFMKREIVIDVNDLRYVRVSCNGCNSRIILDLRDVYDSKKKLAFHLSSKCPHCSIEYDGATNVVLTRLQDAYNALAGMEKSGSIVFIGEETV